CPSPECGHRNAATAEFCARCGAPLAHVEVRGDTAPVLDATAGPGVARSVAYAAAPPQEAPPGPDASPDEKELYWYRNIYQGDKVKQLTFRAVLMGGILGMFMSISNLYTTLQVGWSFGVAITSCVLSYAIWNVIMTLFRGRLTPMSILE